MAKTLIGLAYGVFASVVIAPIGVVMAVGQSIAEDEPIEDAFEDAYDCFKESITEMVDFVDENANIIGPIVAAALKK